MEEKGIGESKNVEYGECETFDVDEGDGKESGLTQVMISNRQMMEVGVFKVKMTIQF